MEGRIEKVVEETGEGIVSAAFEHGGLVLGSSFNARRRGGIGVFLPRPEGSRCRRVLLSVGVRASGVKPPFKWRFKVDGVSVSREFKPHFSVDVDDGVYYKEVYDLTPLLCGRVEEKPSHRAFFMYDGYQTIVIADIAMLAFFDGKGRYSLSYHSGAVAMEPGDLAKVEGFVDNVGGDRVARAGIHLPSPNSIGRIIAGGSNPMEARGPGYRVLEAQIPYRGRLVVAALFHDATGPVYPKKAVLGDVLLLESRRPRPELGVEVTGVEKRDGKILVKGSVANRGSAPAKPLVVVLSMGVRLASLELDHVEPGDSVDFEVLVDPSKMIVPGQRVTVRVVWDDMGRTMFDDAYVSV